MARQFRILALDDDPAMRALFSIAFRNLSIELIFAGHADEAETLVKEQLFHLLLVDFQLDGKSGLEIAEQILIPANLTTPIVLVSAHAATSLQQYVDAGRCVAYKTKPISLKTFGREILNYLTNGSTEDMGETGFSDTLNLESEFLRTALAQAHKFRLSSDSELLAGRALAQAAHKWAGTSGIGQLPRIEVEARRLELLALGAHNQCVPEIRCLLSSVIEQFESASSSLNQSVPST